MKCFKNKNLFLLVISCCLFIVSCKLNKEKKEKDNDIIEALISKMSLEEKVGQLNLTSYTNHKLDSIKKMIRKGMIGGMVKSFGARQNLELQKIAVEESRLGIPILFHEDVIHGYKTITPIPLAEAASWDLKAIKESASIAAKEASAAGIHLTYAPMVDIARDPRWGRILEGAGEDPYLGSLVASARVKGFQETNEKYQNILATAKHFIGYGASLAGRDYNIRDVSERELREIYVPPFKAAINANVSSVMSAYTAYNGVPAVANKFLMRQLLKEELGFKGVTISDWATIGNLVKTGIVQNDTLAVKMAIEAENDIDMTSESYKRLLPEMIRKGIVSEQLINNAVRKVLELKKKAGLLKAPYAYFNEGREKKELLSKENIKVAKDIAVKSMVLLKNENNVLPLKKTTHKIAVIGPFAKEQEDLLGWWSAMGNPKDVISIYNGIKNKINDETELNYEKGCIVEGFKNEGEEEISKAVALAKKSDVVILVLGEKKWMSGEGGGVASLLLPGLQQKLLNELAKTKKTIITIVISGRPYVLTEVVKKSDAVLQAWMPGTTGGTAVSEILFGEANPSGKTPVTFPYHQGQVPIFYNYKRTSHTFKAGDSNNRYTTTHRDIQNEPLFPFGFGLSYNIYEYKNLRLDKSKMKQSDSIKVAIDIRNKGNYKGREIVQLYIQDKVCSVTRPLKELKGFKVLYLKPNEVKTAVFYINKEKLKFIGLNNLETIEKGDFEIYVGPNSSETQKSTFSLE